MKREFDLATYELIDKYLLQELSDQEKYDFEEKLQNDDQLNEEVEKTRVLIHAMNEHQELMVIKSKMDTYHQEMPLSNSVEDLNEKPKKKKGAKFIFRFAVAASVSILSVLSTLYLTGNLESTTEKEITEYAKLVGEVKENVEKVIESQESLSKEFNSFVSESSPKVHIYRGTGFPISENGYIITNFHVIHRAKKIVVENGDSSWRAKVVKIFPNKDLAVLMIDEKQFQGFGNLPYKFKSVAASLGEKIYTLGYPKKDLVFGEGAISSMTGYKGDTLDYQISISVNPGNSGSPVFDDEGNITGVIKGKSSVKEGTSFALKSTFITEIVDDLNSDTTRVPIILPITNKIHYKQRHEQVAAVQSFIYRIRVFR